MSTEYGYRPSSITSNTLDLLTLNPFSEEDVSPMAPEALPYEDEETRLDNSSLRRRSLDTRKETKSISFGKHTRSRTEFDTRISENGVHPLRSAGLAPGPSDAGITRPHLFRVLNEGTLVDAPPVEIGQATAPAVEERDVLVHEVISGDSLAGVSLKYGIAMADLRRANHLWASDSIHLRTELYIPVDKASRLKPIPTDHLISITPGEEILDPMDSFRVHLEAQDSNSPRRPSDAETIRRVPASYLSFFPPPSVNKSTMQSLPSQEHSHTSNANSHNTRYTSSPSNSLTSLLTSLPIAASTRDIIIARLSFDSVSSSYSDREEEANSHELDDVRHATSSNFHSLRDEADDYASLITPKASQRTPRIDAPTVTPQSPPPVLRSQTHVRHMSSSPQSYIPSHPQIRTMQMEPSPTMQLPPLKGAFSLSKGKKARANLVDVDFELENTGGAA